MTARTPIDDIETLMLDMDGTLLDLAFDNWMWLEHIPAAYADRHGLAPAVAHEQLGSYYRRLAGELDWYCLDHWSERLDLDILGLHRAARERIGWLPGARPFLEAARRPGRRVLLVTNAHRDTLALKAEVTGIDRFFDGIHSAHDFGHSKEKRGFWEALARRERFDPQTTLFVDDTEAVLASARDYGLEKLVAIHRPDTSRKARPPGDFPGVHGVRDLEIGGQTP